MGDVAAPGFRLPILLLAVAAGCAAGHSAVVTEPPRDDVVDSVVLLESGSGDTGSLLVTSPGGSVVLDRPYAEADVRSSGAIDVRAVGREEVERRFSSTLESLPPRPTSLTLHFLEGTDELTPDSRPALERLQSLVAGWPAPEISVVGHTDTLGSKAYNDALSLRRAEVVKKALLAIGLDGSRMEVVGRGEREPLVPTDDEVSEPRNRRVEVTVR